REHRDPDRPSRRTVRSDSASAPPGPIESTYLATPPPHTRAHQEDDNGNRPQRIPSVVTSVAHAQHPGVTAADASPAYLSPQQVADMVQVSAKTITRWSLEDASMPVFRRGRVVRFPKEPVLAWLKRQESRHSRRIAHDQRKPLVNTE